MQPGSVGTVVVANRVDVAALDDHSLQIEVGDQSFLTLADRPRPAGGGWSGTGPAAH